MVIKKILVIILKINEIANTTLNVQSLVNLNTCLISNS